MLRRITDMASSPIGSHMSSSLRECAAAGHPCLAGTSESPTLTQASRSPTPVVNDLTARRQPRFAHARGGADAPERALSRESPSRYARTAT
jgi:hypothetical protein